MTYFEWIEKFKPVKNHLNENASMDGMMFETFGDELDFVRSRRNSRIWTIMTGDEDEWLICDGYHIVNRIGYLVTEESSEGDLEVLVD